MNIEFDYELKCNQQCEEIIVFFDIVFSAIAMVLSMGISLFFAYKHLGNYSNPFFQDKIVVILFMAPFYAVTSYFGIVFAHASEYFVLIRDIYEAFLLFTFFYLIFSYLAYEPTINDIIDERVYMTLVKQKEVHHICPMNWCNKPYHFTDKAKGKYFVYRCKKYILQFLIVKPLATLIIIITSFFQEDSETALWFQTIASYAAMTSVTLSLYYLVLFYHALSKPLSPHRPLLKFLTVKTTLFFTFWQTIALSVLKPKILSYFDESAPGFNEDKIIARIQNTLVCLEMLILSVASGIAFSYKDFITNNPLHKGTWMGVIKGNIKSFSRDYRLIKPKVFGFKGHAEIHERGSDDKRFSSRILRDFRVSMKTNDLESALVSACDISEMSKEKNLKSLSFETIKQGDGANFPKKGAILLCHYTATLSNGDIIDSSRDKSEPFEFQIGIGEVIPAWESILPQMSVGQKVLVVVPPEHAYGKAGIPGVVPANAGLRFEIELLAIKL